MSVQASSWVIKNSKHKGSALLVLLMIANHAHGDGTNAFPSVKTLADECRMSERQIIRIVAQLEASGELIIERSQGRKTNNYAVCMTDNPVKKSRLNPDKLTPKKTANPDKSDTATLTNPTISIYKDEPSLGKEEEARPRPKKLSPEEASAKLEKGFDFDDSETEAEKIYREFYPTTPLSPYQLGLINEITLLPDLWRSVLRYWKGKNNVASNIDGLTDRYAKELKKQTLQPTNGFVPLGAPRTGLLSDAIKR